MLGKLGQEALRKDFHLLIRYREELSYRYFGYIRRFIKQFLQNFMWEVLNTYIQHKTTQPGLVRFSRRHGLRTNAIPD